MNICIGIVTVSLGKVLMASGMVSAIGIAVVGGAHALLVHERTQA